jgi:hypothetical protein
MREYYLYKVHLSSAIFLDDCLMVVLIARKISMSHLSSFTRSIKLDLTVSREL